MSQQKMLIATSAVAVLAIGLAVIPVLRAQDATDGARKPQASERIFELRTYHCSPGKLPALEKRFREHTVKLFEKHGMTNIGYWTPAEGQAGHGETLIYLLAYPDQKSKEKAWKEFGADPEWKKVKADSEANGPLVDHIDRYFMDPTSFSALK